MVILNLKKRMQKCIFIGSIFIPENKRLCFCHIDNFWKGHAREVMADKLRKPHAKTRIYIIGSIFIPEKYIFRVCFEDDIQPDIQVSPLLVLEYFLPWNVEIIQ